MVDVTARPETGFAQLEEEVEREIDLYREGVTELEVKRAVALIETDLLLLFSQRRTSRPNLDVRHLLQAPRAHQRTG